MMSQTRDAAKARRTARGLLCCLIVGAALSASACSERTPRTPDPAPLNTGGPPVQGTSPGPDSLVYLAGASAFSPGDAADSPTLLFELAAEPVWGGPVTLSGEGDLIYPGVAGNGIDVRRAGVTLGEMLLMRDATALHCIVDDVLLASDPSDTYLIELSREDVGPKALGIGAVSSATLSGDGTEFAYASQPQVSPGDAPQEASPPGRLSIRAIDGTGQGTAVEGEWSACVPLVLEPAALLYLAYPLEGFETGDLVLFDRATGGSTTLATDVRLLGHDAPARAIALARTDAETGAEEELLVVELSAAGVAEVTAFQSDIDSSVTTVSIVSGSGTLLAGVVHSDGSATIELLGIETGTRSVLASFPDATVSQVLADPAGSTVFAVLESEGERPEEPRRSIVSCPMDPGATATVAEHAGGERLWLVGFTRP